MGERRTYMPENFQCLEMAGQSGLGNLSAQEFPRWTGHFRAGQAARQALKIGSGGKAGEPPCGGVCSCSTEGVQKG